MWKVHALIFLFCLHHSNFERMERFNDPEYMHQWYLEDDEIDYMNIAPVWDRGLSGKGVTICIIDDGIDHSHADLKSRFNKTLSYDFNDPSDVDHDPAPSDSGLHDAHGTMCAGVAGAEANNAVCGVGVAYGATICGFRLLDGHSSSLMEARAMAYFNSQIDIKSMSWGPTDDGRTFENPSPGVLKSIEDGVKNGRQGKGVLFVWAAGNGGSFDHGGADGFASNHNVFSITSVKQDGRPEHYTEAGMNIIAAVYAGQGTSMSGKRLNGIIAPNSKNRCKLGFAGTSAATPLASGIFALLLESNPDLTYRDVMYIVAATAQIPPNPDEEWRFNGAGYHIHNRIGFGTLDAEKMIQVASNWTRTPSRMNCKMFKTVSVRRKFIPINTTFIEWNIEVMECTHINKMEHAIVTISMGTNNRGGIKLCLTSPSGTVSELLNYRSRDGADERIDHFPFTTNRYWGENPNGSWKIEIWLKAKGKTAINTEQITIDSFNILGV